MRVRLAAAWAAASLRQRLAIGALLLVAAGQVATIPGSLAARVAVVPPGPAAAPSPTAGASSPPPATPGGSPSPSASPTLSEALSPTPAASAAPTPAPTARPTARPTPSPDPTPPPTPSPTSLGFWAPPGWDGVSDVDCGDIDTRAHAQSFFLGTGGSTTNDPYGLDGDGDGIACESLP